MRGVFVSNFGCYPQYLTYTINILLLITEKHEKWRVHDLSCIKHQTILKSPLGHKVMIILVSIPQNSRKIHIWNPEDTDHSDLTDLEGRDRL